MSIPTPEQFLAQTEPDEDDDLEQAAFTQPTIGGGTIAFTPESVIFGRAVPPQPTALESMAASLSIISSALAAQASAGQADAEAERRYLDLDQAFADLEDKHQALYGLLSEVEKIVAPSTSKLANSVREAITRWRNPEVPAEDEPEAVHYANCDEPDPSEHAPYPAYDADVEEWRGYARQHHAVPEGTVLDQMNRSQIRTLLGVPQVEA